MSVTVGRPNRLVDERSSATAPAARGGVADQGVDLALGRRDDPAHHRIGFGMHRRGIERIVAGGDAQEAGALLERLGAEPRHLLQRLAGPEGAVRVAVGDDALRQRLADARDARQQRRRCRVEVDADAVDAILDHGIERARQLEFAEIVLVLADADRLRIDLHQFGQRILQPARDRHRAAQGHVEAGQLLRRIGRGRIDRRAGFRHHDLLQLELRQPLRPARSRACRSRARRCRCRSRSARPHARAPACARMASDSSQRRCGSCG